MIFSVFCRCYPFVTFYYVVYFYSYSHWCSRDHRVIVKYTILSSAARFIHYCITYVSPEIHTVFWIQNCSPLTIKVEKPNLQYYLNHICFNLYLKRFWRFLCVNRFKSIYLLPLRRVCWSGLIIYLILFLNSIFFYLYLFSVRSLY